MSRATLEELQNDPRPLSADEAARILDLSPSQLLALGPPVVGRTAEGDEVYDFEDVAHWARVRRDDPRQFEARLAGYPGEAASNQ